MWKRRGKSRSLCDACASGHPEGVPCTSDEVSAARDRLKVQERTVVGLLAWAKQSRQDNDYARRLRAAYAAEPRGRKG